MERKTKRLCLKVLDARQLALWVENLPTLEAELGVRYDADEMQDWFIGIVNGQRQAVENDPDNTAWHSFWWIVADGVVVGSADFKAPPVNGEAEIGYGLGANHRGHGFMTETVNEMCRFAFEHSTVERIIAETEKDNEKSHNVLLRCGFSLYREGETLWWKKERATEKKEKKQ